MKNIFKINGISVCNPVDIEKEYLMYTVDYAIRNNINHIQFIGPIHNAIKGNVDGMTLFRKYSQFNCEKDLEFLERTTEYVREASKKASEHGIKSYVWHHELEVPAGFIDAYPEILNSDGDVEVTHPLIRDFLENKIEDFFFEYPDIDGLILTLHETRIPLLKLKNQKLDPIGRVKYVTEILYKTCCKLGKELIVRPFASLERDYELMLESYEAISTDLIVMDKWTQFDWSLTSPHNAFFKKIDKNPLLVETDIFGEFFGQGHLPLMLKNHIKEKVNYCNSFNPEGYVSRVDRWASHPFGTVNEINLDIMNAYMGGKDVDAVIDTFFEERYPDAAKEVRDLMEPTEEILIKLLYLKGFFFSELSTFPKLNHCKNHFYFEMMKDNYDIASDEWFIPRNWERGTIESVINEKKEAVLEAEKLFDKLESIKVKIAPADYIDLYNKFLNLKFATLIWYELTKVLINYTKFFETNDVKYKTDLMQNLDNMLALHNQGLEALGKDFYCRELWIEGNSELTFLVPDFVESVKESFEAEEAETKMIAMQNPLDYIICGGGFEGHRLQKEVNFSDTYILNGKLCRIPGCGKGANWSVVNAHGWFSYEIKVKPNSKNTIRVLAGSKTSSLKFAVTIDENRQIIDETVDNEKEITLIYNEDKGNTSVRIRFDRLTKDVPYIYYIISESDK